MKPDNIKLIIVPDVHGRVFWEDVFRYNTDIVFLGDYLDPYPFEEIFPWDALDNFMHILLFAKKNPKVHLLLGNHDLAYIKRLYLCSNRVDIANYNEIRRLFSNYQYLFTMAYDCSINRKKYFISHAGITPGWYEKHPEIFDKSFAETLCADYINQLYSKGSLDRILGDVSCNRGGADKFGSMVWADIHEHANGEEIYKTDVIQIVGHSQRSEFPFRIEKNYLVYDVDIRQCVYLDNQGDLRSLKTGEKYVFD